jgi:hypothetical protein
MKDLLEAYDVFRDNVAKLLELGGPETVLHVLKRTINIIERIEQDETETRRDARKAIE